MLKPQDIVILLNILSTLGASNDSPLLFTQNVLAFELCMSASEVNAGIKRLVFSGLLSPVVLHQGFKKIAYQPNKKACEECLIYGVKYFFPVQLGSYTRGIATSYAAPLLSKNFVLGDDPIPVWPYGEGNMRGLALEPLYNSVPKSISKFHNVPFYELLVLVDAIRSGRAREKNIAIELLKAKLHGKQQREKSASKSKNA